MKDIVEKLRDAKNGSKIKTEAASAIEYLRRRNEYLQDTLNLAIASRDQYMTEAEMYKDRVELFESEAKSKKSRSKDTEATKKK